MAAKNASVQADGIPDLFFHALAHLIPGLNLLAEKECQITLGEWLALWFIRQEGVQNVNKESTILRQDLTKLLAKRGFGAASISRLLDSLQRKGLIRRATLTPQERNSLFRIPSGNKMAVILEPTGVKKIALFKRVVEARFETWRSEQTLLVRTSYNALRRSAMQFVEWLSEGQRAP